MRPDVLCSGKRLSSLVSQSGSSSPGGPLPIGCPESFLLPSLPATAPVQHQPAAPQARTNGAQSCGLFTPEARGLVADVLCTQLWNRETIKIALGLTEYTGFRGDWVWLPMAFRSPGGKSIQDLSIEPERWGGGAHSGWGRGTRLFPANVGRCTGTSGWPVGPSSSRPLSPASVDPGAPDASGRRVQGSHLLRQLFLQHTEPGSWCSRDLPTQRVS